MGSLERSFDSGVRRAATGRTRQVNRAGANDRDRCEWDIRIRAREAYPCPAAVVERCCNPPLRGHQRL